MQRFRRSQTSALCYGEEFLAVGLTSGPASLYYATSHQEYNVLDHGEAVKFIAFQRQNSPTGNLRLEKPPRPLDMDFDGDTLRVASNKNYVASWGLGQGAQPEPAQRPWSNALEPDHTPLHLSPCAFTLCASHGMLAVAHLDGDLALLDPFADRQLECFVPTAKRSPKLQRVSPCSW
ncbi:hypothetical protein DL766_004691 [Monosporascus sp. MC13-8B]|uniref:CNH domain-containing protein n=1 Tax=Monosporascus cannonballus TaxID=155416 RepID=A0ABY0H355_9PEZI|nr:hypothetical protein DL762_006225 [Monosporascus cannonballus]RYO99244.1 hypothetical protein DL763_001608 [Monosporascus cannonballus]RYP30864.1 hypothetical protein DL766_004691 [Monosporascus sp. MC13-8B]